MKFRFENQTCVSRKHPFGKHFESYPMLLKYCSNRQDWRKFIADYCNLIISDSKEKLLKLFYCSAPGHEISFICKLEDEIENGIELLLKSEEYKYLDKCLRFRENPVYSKLAYILAEEEHRRLFQKLDNCFYLRWMHF